MRIRGRIRIRERMAYVRGAVRLVQHLRRMVVDEMGKARLRRQEVRCE